MRTLISLIVVVLVVSGAANADLVAHYALDGNGNNSVGNGFNATAVGTVTYSSGAIGQGANFSGSYLASGSGLFDGEFLPGSGSYGTAFTVTTWVNYSTSGINKLLGVNNSWGMTEIFGDIYWDITGVGSVNTTGGAGVLDGTWHHLAGTWDGSTLALYIDGTLSVSTPASGSAGWDGSTFNIGANSNGTYPLTGSLDDIGIWNGEALDATQIGSVMANGVPEPATMVLLGLGGLLLRRRRS